MGGRRSGWLASPVINVRATRQGGRGSEEAERCLVFQTSRCAGLVVRLVTMENNAPQPGKLLPPARPARPPGPAPRPAPRPALQRSGGAAGAGREGRARRGAGGPRPWPGLRSAGLGGPGGAGPRRAGTCAPFGAGGRRARQRFVLGPPERRTKGSVLQPCRGVLGLKAKGPSSPLFPVDAAAAGGRGLGTDAPFWREPARPARCPVFGMS